MCGIISYIGTQDATPFLLLGLQRLEYRGYDSAGLALVNGTKLRLFKAAGEIDNLVKKVVTSDKLVFKIGLAHTRWATHGEANEKNAHPHLSNDKDLIGVHNGTIENYGAMKERLIQVGYRFVSSTDSEVLINFIHFIQKSRGLNLLNAVQAVYPQIEGTCALVLFSRSENCLVAINKGGQLCFGRGDSGFFIASDKIAFAGQASSSTEIGHEQILKLEPDQEPQLLGLNSETMEIVSQEIDIDISELSLEGFSSFMLKEIFAQPEVVRRALQGRFDFSQMSFRFGGLDDYWEQIKSQKQLTIVACGTSWHAGLLGKYWLERLAQVSVKVEYASEFDPCVIEPGDVVIGISQSGNTADTIAALQLAKQRGAIILGICNVVDSTIARLTDAGVYTRAGVEKGVASTKAFMAQAIVLLLLALKLAKEKKTISRKQLKSIIGFLEVLPQDIEKVLSLDKAIQAIAQKFKDSKNFLYLGKDYNFPIALEGALKLKEISYIHAEGMSSGEMKHGPLALIDEEMPVVMVATQGSNYQKIITSLKEVQARHGQIIALVNNHDDEVKQAVVQFIHVPLSDEVIAPLINVVVLQLLAYHLAKELGRNVDHPRNLAKSVTTH